MTKEVDFYFNGNMRHVSITYSGQPRVFGVKWVSKEAPVLLPSPGSKTVVWRLGMGPFPKTTGYGPVDGPKIHNSTLGVVSCSFFSLISLIPKLCLNAKNKTKNL